MRKASRLKPSLIGRTGRNTHGGALLLGVAWSILFCALLALLTLFIYDLGLGSYYQEKIHSLTKQALSSYISKLAWCGAHAPASGAAPETEVSDEINQALTAMGFPGANVNCSVTKQVATVAVSVHGFALFNGPNFFPTTINFDDSQSLNLASARGPGVVGLYVQSGQNGAFAHIFVPSYGRFVTPYSNGQADLRTAPNYTAAFYNADVPYNQYDVQFLPGYGDAYSDNY